MQSLLARVRRDTNLKDLLRHSGVLYAGGLISTILTIVQQITTASLLGSSDYGRLATVLGSSMLVMLILDVRTWELGTKLLARPILDKSHDEAVRIVTWLTLTELVLGVAGASLLFLLAQPLATYLLHAPELDWLIRLYAVSVPFHMLALGVAGTLLRLYDRFDWLSAKSIGYAMLRLILMSGAAFIGLGLVGVITGAIIGEILNALALLVMAWAMRRREMPHTPLVDLTKPRSFAEGRKMMGQLWVSATLRGLQLETFVPILALLTSPEQVGLFRSGLDVAEMIAKMTAPFSIVLYPRIVKSYAQSTRAEFLRLIKQSTLILASLAVPLVLGIVLIGPSAFPRLLPTGYAGIATVASVLAAGYGISAIFLWIRPTIVAFGLIREQNILGFVLMLLSIGALVILAPAYGALGAAIVMGTLLAGANTGLLLLLRHAMSQNRTR